MINLTNAAGCAGPELLGLQHKSQPSFEMGSWPFVRGSFLSKSLAGCGQLPNPPGVEARTNLHSAAFWRGVCSVTVDLDVSCCIGKHNLPGSSVLRPQLVKRKRHVRRNARTNMQACPPTSKEPGLFEPSTRGFMRSKDAYVANGACLFSGRGVWE
jgi:hypothetical protein